MATRYWVGGTGNWDASDTTHWSAASGGGGGASVPTSTDDVVFDTASNANAYTCTVTATANCQSITFANPASGALTLAGSSVLNIYGSFTISSTITRTFTGQINFFATTTGKTLTFNSITFASTVRFEGTGGGWTLQDAWNNGTSSISLIEGSLDTNDKTVTCGTFSISDNTTRAIDLGSSTINCRSWNAATTTLLTFTVGTSTIALYGGSSGDIFQGGGLTYNIVTITNTLGDSNGHGFTGANTFGTLTFTGPSVGSQNWRLSANQTVTGTLTISGNSLINRLLIRSSTQGTARTITAATTTLSNVDFQDITGGGAGSWSGTSIGNALGNTGITFTTPVTRYAVVAGNWSSTATWSTTSGGGGGASVPLCHDTVYLNGSSAAGTYTADMPRLGADIDCTGFTRTLTTSTTASIFGSLTLASGMTLTASTQTYTFEGRGSHTLTNAGKTWAKVLDFGGFGGTYTLQDALVATNTNGIDITSGTFDANDKAVTVDDCTISSGATVIMGTGTWTLNGTGTVWSASSGCTVTTETSTIAITDTSTSAKTFAGGGKTYNKLSIQGAGIATYTISGSNTFTTFESTKAVAHTIKFTTGTTQTITNWSVTGTVGNVVTIDSTTTGTHALVKSGAGRVSADYLNIQHSVATPALSWYAGANSTNNQATATAGSGWYFIAPGFTNPGNIYTSNNVYATYTAPDGVVTAELSKDAGVTWTSPLTVTLTGSDTTQTFGTGSTELWGSSWTRADMVDSLFRIRLSHSTTGAVQIYKTFGFATGSELLTGIEITIEGNFATTTMSLDLLQVKIYYGTSVIPVQAGSQAFASNGRKNGEGVGAGTGVLVFYDGTNWKAVDTGATVAA
jgi:hypothetical protein